MSCEGGTLAELMEAIYEHKLPGITVYQLHLCGCNMGHCGSVLGYQEYRIGTVWDMVTLVGVPEPWYTPYLSYPDSVCLSIDPMTQDTEVKDSCYSNVTTDILKAGNGFTYCYSR